MRESILLRVCVNPSSGLPSNGQKKIIELYVHEGTTHMHTDIS